jgi:uncharacterized BrkB/YihY/UPF0761 family membrane protein
MRSEAGQMIARLGDVLYWTFTGIGVLLTACVLYFFFPALTALMQGQIRQDELGITVIMFVIYIAPGVILLLIGRACRYVLAGR